ncbi:MAG: hypothetical protein ACRC6V_00560 [Bacteroidales bacterium]
MSYGVEIVSPEGNKFTIPDSNPYTFCKKMTVSNTQGAVNTGIPTSVQMLTFFRLEPGSVIIVGGANQVPINGYWHIFIVSLLWEIKVDAYIFTNREYNNINSAYGVQIFDESGAFIIGNNSRPLKMSAVPFVEPTDPNQSVVSLGYPAAVTASIVRCYKGSSAGISTTYGYALGAIGAADGYSTHSKDIGYSHQWIPYSSANYPQTILTINTNDYQ